MDERSPARVRNAERLVNELIISRDRDSRKQFLGSADRRAWPMLIFGLDYNIQETWKGLYYDLNPERLSRNVIVAWVG